MASCVISGLPNDVTLGDVEALVSPKCSGRIVSIGIQGEGVATVDFALPSDCDSVLGDHEVLGGTVKISRPGEAVLPPMQQGGAKRQRDPEPVMPPGPAEGAGSSSSAFDMAGAAYDGASLVAAAAPSAPGLDAQTSSASSSSTLVTGLADVADGAPLPPATKKQRSSTGSNGGGGGGPPGESKKEKEKRLNRVGLSYRCGRCGQPKKGHVCVGQGEGAPPGQGATSPGGSDGSNGQGSNNRTPPGVSPTGLGISPTSGWDLDSDSIFKDIKSVLQTPAAAVPPPPPKANGKASGSKRRSNGASKSMPPPPVVAAAAGDKGDKSQLLEELDIAMQRPPSVITPEDGDGSKSAAAGPSSLLSATDMFSPGQLMTHLLGTPTPAITPGLSPGTLNELGNMLQSPAPPLSAGVNGPPSLGTMLNGCSNSPAIASAARKDGP